jgi:hypothetical protein
MNKREADTVLLACKKRGIFLSMRKEGDIYLVTFIKKIEIVSFEAAKHITNGLAVERKFKNEIKESVSSEQVNSKISVSNYPKRKTRDDVVSFSERIRNNKE